MIVSKYEVANVKKKSWPSYIVSTLQQKIIRYFVFQPFNLDKCTKYLKELFLANTYWVLIIFTKIKFLTNQFYFQSEEKFEVRRCVEEAAIVVTSDAEIKASCTITLTSPVMRETATPEGGKDKY